MSVGVSPRYSTLIKLLRANSDKFAYVPFGEVRFISIYCIIIYCMSGRHRCIGERFAYVQIKTIWSVLLKKYEFDLVDGHFPPVNYQTMTTNPVIAYKLRVGSK